MNEIQNAIETLNVMESSYSHIRKIDSEFEAIEAGKSALQDQAERERGCEYCNGHVHAWKFCPMCGRDLRKPVSK